MNKRGRKPKEEPIFENDEYRITKVPLNYAIDVKLMVDGTKQHKQVKLIGEPLYTDVDEGIEAAHDMARHMIHKYLLVSSSKEG